MEKYIKVGGLHWALELLSGPRGVVNPKNGISYFVQDEAVAEATEQGLLVPTEGQYEQLVERTTQKWIKRRWYDRWFRPDRQTGTLLTDKENGNTLFFPASGYRDTSNGSFNYVTTNGYYWLSSVYNATLGYLLNFNQVIGVIPQYNYYRSYGFPVRCLVAEIRSHKQ